METEPTLSTKSSRLNRSAADELADEARWMAGNPRNHAGRAVAYYHLYAHSGGRHVTGLLAAEDTLALNDFLKRMHAVAEARWPWETKDKVAARVVATEEVIAAFRRLDGERCADMLFAYRLSASERLRKDAIKKLGKERVEALSGGDAMAIQRAEGFSAPVDRQPEGLFALAESLPGRTLKRLAHAAAGCLACDEASVAKALKKDPERIAKRLRKDDEMPRLFHENPGQAYFRMLNDSAAKRREEQALLEPDMAEDSVTVV